jgi:hypothetical protein
MSAASAGRLQGPAEPIPLTVLTGFLGASFLCGLALA